MNNIFKQTEIEDLLKYCLADPLTRKIYLPKITDILGASYKYSIIDWSTDFKPINEEAVTKDVIKVLAKLFLNKNEKE